MTGTTEKKDVRFIVTGFGPFGGVPDNPTSVLAAKLVGYLQGTSSTIPLASLTKTVIIETSAEGSRTQVDRLRKEHLQENGRVTTILLHLGVHYKGDSFQLEECAYNDASFRIPDEKGFQPKEESILGETVAVGTRLQTRLDVSALAKQLLDPRARQKEVGPCPVVVSTDPGRFVCNFTYCYSLHTFQCSQQAVCSNKNDDDDDDVQCLFLHVPPFAVAPEEEQLAFVAQLMLLLYHEQKEKPPSA